MSGFVVSNHPLPRNPQVSIRVEWAEGEFAPEAIRRTITEVMAEAFLAVDNREAGERGDV